MTIHSRKPIAVVHAHGLVVEVYAAPPPPPNHKPPEPTGWKTEPIQTSGVILPFPRRAA